MRCVYTNSVNLVVSRRKKMAKKKMEIKKTHTHSSMNKVKKKTGENNNANNNNITKQRVGMKKKGKSGDHHADNKKAEEKLDIFNKSFVRSSMGAIVHDVYIKRCP